ncbi:MAG: FAD-dependent monooxygenase, partial [Desulfomonilaceae bacterium]
MKRRTIKCDVLVVGGGPAGSVAAETVARHGLRVLLVDKKKRIGERPHCGEFIPEKLMKEFDLSSKIVDQKVDAMETMIIEGTLPDQRAFGTAMFAKKKVRSQIRKSHECDYESVNTPSTGYTIDRSALDLGLAKRAASSGAVILNDSKLVKFNHQRSLVIRQREEIVIDSKVTIAADGANSAISSALGYPKPEFL